MPKKPFSFNFFFSRFMILCNLLFTLLALSFFIIINNELLTLDIPPYMKETIPHINILLLLLGGFILLGNIVLLLVFIFYSSQKYFKVLEKLDFTDISGAINILDNLNTIDEIGDLGKNIARLLEVYINYATFYKKRLSFEQSKAKFLIHQIEKGAMLLTNSLDEKNFFIQVINPQASKMLNIELLSGAIGHSFISYLESNSQKQFVDMINDLRDVSSLDGNTKIKQLEESIEVELYFVTSSTLNTESKAIPYKVKIFPIVLQFYDDFRYKNVENLNTYIDALFLILE